MSDFAVYDPKTGVIYAMYKCVFNADDDLNVPVGMKKLKLSQDHPAFQNPGKWLVGPTGKILKGATSEP